MSKFEQFLVELTDFKKRELSLELAHEKQPKGFYAVEKGDKIVKKFQVEDYSSSQKALLAAKRYASACNNNSKSENFTTKFYKG